MREEGNRGGWETAKRGCCSRRNASGDRSLEPRIFRKTTGRPPGKIHILVFISHLLRCILAQSREGTSQEDAHSTSTNLLLITLKYFARVEVFILYLSFYLYCSLWNNCEMSPSSNLLPMFASGSLLSFLYERVPTWDRPYYPKKWYRQNGASTCVKSSLYNDNKMWDLYCVLQLMSDSNT